MTWATLPMWQRTAYSSLPVIYAFHCYENNYANVRRRRILGFFIVALAALPLLAYDTAKVIMWAIKYNWWVFRWSKLYAQCKQVLYFSLCAFMLRVYIEVKMHDV